MERGRGTQSSIKYLRNQRSTPSGMFGRFGSVAQPGIIVIGLEAVWEKSVQFAVRVPAGSFSS